MTTLSLLALCTFLTAYSLVVSEDFTKLRKSKPLLLGAGAIWVMASLAGNREAVADGLRDSVYEFGQLFLFLLVAIAYVNAIRARGVFDWISARCLAGRGGLRRAFWITGILAFLLSPVADNLTTALVLGAVVSVIGQDNSRFVVIASINIVVAANAGGAFSPFGDLTTLMVWQAGKVQTANFLWLIAPALVSWLIPAFVIQFSIDRADTPSSHPTVKLHADWAIVVGLFVATIATAVLFHGVLHLPPFLGMTTGLGYYMMYCYFDCRRHGVQDPGSKVFEHIRGIEWDTMLFFFGVILCLGGLRVFGHLHVAAQFLYGDLGTTPANLLVGLASAVLDNVPVMFAVLGMDLQMGQPDWLLVTLTAGIGGSLLSIGSAAGVALMGASRGAYTFTRHLVWTPVIFIGCVAGVAVHLWITAAGLIPS